MVKKEMEIYDDGWKKSIFEEVKDKYSDIKETTIKFGVFRDTVHLIKGQHPADIEREIWAENFVLVDGALMINSPRMKVEFDPLEIRENEIRFKACSNGFDKMKAEKLQGYKLVFPGFTARIHNNCIGYDLKMIRMALADPGLDVMGWITYRQGGVPVVAQITIEKKDLETENDQAYQKLNEGY